VSATVPRTLFVGRGAGAVTWYRCALPAMVLGFEWIGAHGDPEQLVVQSGMTRRPLRFADFADYEVVVLQQPQGRAWLDAIRALQAGGTVVLFEVDDYLRAIRRLKHHDFKQHFDREAVEAFELCMRAADGVICSTPWLANRYRALNPRTWVCRNGIDLRRYALTRPQRDTLAVGWAGATGHTESVLPWLRELAVVMREHPRTRFISVGQAFAQALEPEFGAERALSVPFAGLDTYPATMTLFDVALAPAGKGNFFRGKSDLRWLEASALGIPLIADPDVYPEIEHGVTGFHAREPGEVRAILRELIADAELRRRVGEAARAYVTEHRRIEVAAQQWAEVLTTVTTTTTSTAA